jgi:hypothetical protein
MNASAHLDELSRLHLLDTFATHFHAYRNKGVGICAAAVAYPRLLPKIDFYRRLFRENGIEIEFAPFIGSYGGKSYPADYTAAERNAFGLSDQRVSPHQQKGELCNAGYNVVVASPNGDVYPCFNARNDATSSGLLSFERGLRLGNLYTGFRFEPQLVKCPYHLCICPMNVHDQYLFSAAKRLTRIDEFRYRSGFPTRAAAAK